MSIFSSLNLNNGIMADGSKFGTQTMVYEADKLKAEAYICRILDAQEVGTSWGKQLEIMFDISDGNFKDYFKKQYDANPFAERKYKGYLKINIPATGATASRDLMIINNFFEAVTSSNESFILDESTEFSALKGCKVGIVFREEEYYFDQKEGITVKPYCAISTKRVKEGDYIIPNRKPLSEKQRRQKQADATLNNELDGDYPF